MPNTTSKEIVFESLMKEHYSYILNFVARYTSDKWTAEEITQDTFVEAHRYIDKLGSHPNIRGWLIKTATYNIRDSIKVRRKDSMVSYFDDLKQTPSYYDTYNEMEVADLKKLLNRHLNPKAADIVYLFYKEKMPIKDIALLLNISESNCKTILHRARKKLEKKLSKDFLKNM